MSATCCLRSQIAARIRRAAPAADAAAQRDTQAAALNARIGRIETAQDSQILELEDLPADPAYTAMRARFTEPHHEREQVET